jgi:hypothetical protein
MSDTPHHSNICGNKDIVDQRMRKISGKKMGTKTENMCKNQKDSRTKAVQELDLEDPPPG